MVVGVSGIVLSAVSDLLSLIGSDAPVAVPGAFTRGPTSSRTLTVVVSICRVVKCKTGPVSMRRLPIPFAGIRAMGIS